MSFWNGFGIVLSLTFFVGALHSQPIANPPVIAVAPLQIDLDGLTGDHLFLRQTSEGVHLHGCVRNLPPGWLELQIPDFDFLVDIEANSNGLTKVDLHIHGYELQELVGHEIILSDTPDPLLHRSRFRHRRSSMRNRMPQISGVIALSNAGVEEHRCECDLVE